MSLPSGRGVELMSVFAFFMIVSTIITALRIYVRTTLVKSGPEDYLSVIGYILFILHGGFAIAGAFHGTGQHANLLPIDQIHIALKWWWVCEPLYVVSNMAVKLSIALMLLRFTIEPVHKLIVIGITAILELYSVAFFFIFIFQCSTPSSFWKGGKCNLDPVIISVYIYSVITCISDWSMSILPWILVKDMQLNRATKIMVAVVLGCGSIASIATIARIPYIRHLTDRKDFLYSTTDVAIWSCCETGLSIIASSVATLKPLLKGVATQKPSKPGDDSSAEQGITVAKAYNVKDSSGDDSLTTYSTL